MAEFRPVPLIAFGSTVSGARVFGERRQESEAVVDGMLTKVFQKVNPDVEVTPDALTSLRGHLGWDTALFGATGRGWENPAYASMNADIRQALVDLGYAKEVGTALSDNAIASEMHTEALNSFYEGLAIVAALACAFSFVRGFFAPRREY